MDVASGRESNSTIDVILIDLINEHDNVALLSCESRVALMSTSDA